MSNADGSLLMASVPSAMAQILDTEAAALVARLEPEGEPAASQARFRPTRFLDDVHIEGKEIQTQQARIVLDLEGSEIARYFPVAPNEWVGLSGEAWEKLVALCRQLFMVEAVAQCISLTSLVEAGCGWLAAMHREGKPAAEEDDSPAAVPPSFTQHILAVCEAAVESVEVCVPLSGVSFEMPFSLGGVRLKNVTSSDLQLWADEWVSRWKNEGHPLGRHPHADRAAQTFARASAQAKLGPIPVAAVMLRAEPVRAVERALDEAERVTAILRYYSMANFEPLATSRCAVEGTVNDGGPRHLLLRAQVLVAVAGTAEEWPGRPPEKFGVDSLAKMRAKGLDKLDALLRLEPEQRTPWQRQVLKALEVYGKASLTRDVRDKLLYVVVALESLLVRGREGSLKKNVAERVAYLLGRSLEHRRAIINAYTTAYEARSDAVHRGEVPADLEALREFLHHAWHALNQIIRDNDLYSTQDDFLDSLDEIKFKP